jgi:hypothetical protein
MTVTLAPDAKQTIELIAGQQITDTTNDQYRQPLALLATAPTWTVGSRCQPQAWPFVGTVQNRGQVRCLKGAEE